MPRSCFVTFLLCLVLALPVTASPGGQSAGCDLPSAVQKALKEGRQPAPGQSQSAFGLARLEQLQALDAKYPGHFVLARSIYYQLDWLPKAEKEALRERWIKEAGSKPDNPYLLTRAAFVLNRRDTDAAIKNLKAARSAAPQYPWAALVLSEILSTGKRADMAEAKRHFAAFYDACPASTDGTALWVLPKVGGPEMVKKVAAALRADLDKTKDLERLREFSSLWGMEFRATAVAEHGALRERVTRDVRRLDAMNRKPDAGWLLLLRDGMKQAGASKEVQAAYEDRVLKQFPSSFEAARIEMARWSAAHPEPTDHTVRAPWQEHAAQRAAFYLDIATRIPAAQYVKSSYFYYRLMDDRLTEAEGVKLIEARLEEGEKNYPDSSNESFSAAAALLQQGWQPARALELAQKTLRLAEKEDAEPEASDNWTEAEAAEQKRYEGYNSIMARSLVLRAAVLAGRPDAAAPLAPKVDGPVPADKERLVSYWADRARLARLQKRTADALGYYQQALHARTRQPKPYQGKVQDEIGDEARALWKELGGTDTAWKTWAEVPAAALAVNAEGSWTNATKTLPAFELKDLEGKTWTLAGLKGKSVLINLWATWCGPCMAELPHLQKLYENTKGRSDIQVLSFNVDEELGLVAPFMKEKGFSFPVLPAYDLVMSLRDSGFGIPQNWLLDPTGKWRSLQLGFDASATDWEEQVLKKLEDLKK